MSNPSVSSILDFPDEILAEIILHLDAKERLALGNSCQKFNDLVFRDEELLRNLDFTGELQLTRASDIQQYFDDENTYKKILGINTENVQAVSSIRSSISKAINLVDLNIQSALFFESIEELSCLLKPLVHLKRLSVSWPGSDLVLLNYDNPNRNQVLEEPLSRLTYLSVEIKWYSKDFLLILQLCQQLERLRMKVLNDSHYPGRPSRREPMKVGSLKSVQITTSYGQYLGPTRNDLMTIVPEPAEWTDFSLVDSDYTVYLERNVEVCAGLGKVVRMPLPQYIADLRILGMLDEVRPLVPEVLLIQVIKITHEDVPEKFHCLSPSRSYPHQPNSCMCLQIDEAKRLLKDPGYQISYLRFFHPIEKNCDMHLVASAFPNLTTLVLSGISDRDFLKCQRRPEKNKPLHRRLRRKGSLTPEETSDTRNMDSSFEMLVENTPRLKVLKISSRDRDRTEENWDLDALNLISGWKNLTVICLCNIPITDGKFLIEIGRECKKLKEVELRLLRLNDDYSYESEVLKMLQHCQNLRKLTIAEKDLKHLSEMFNILSNCSRLAALTLVIIREECVLLELTSSVEKMLRQCPELKQFFIHFWNYQFSEELKRHIERIVGILDRPYLQFRCINGLLSN